METLNRADSLIYETEKTLRDNGDKLSDEDKNSVQAEIDAFKKVREGNAKYTARLSATCLFPCRSGHGRSPG